jgi:hypothetical protein
MARIIPNENTWVGFATTVASLNAPTAAEVAAAVDLTPYVISINASSQGNTVPTPSFDTLFETSIAGTVQASFSADFYRDDDPGVGGDLAWKTLPRRTNGFFVISRFGGAGAGNLPIAADKVEVWPVLVVSRTMANMSNNTVMTFTVTGSVPKEPAEAATVAA